MSSRNYTNGFIQTDANQPNPTTGQSEPRKLWYICINNVFYVSCRYMDTTLDILYIAGVSSIETLLQYPGQVASHDFSGCLRDFIINGKTVQSQKPIASNGITDTCQRTAEGVCMVEGKAICENGATCIDEWDTYRCHCPDGYTGDNCDQCKFKSNMLQINRLEHFCFYLIL